MEMIDNKDIIEKALNKKVKLGFFPTPISELKNMSKALNGPKIYIKRDDHTGLAFGGNKTRKIEYLLYDALQKQCNCIITVGAPQSNFCRQTAAACRIYNLECFLLLIGKSQSKEVQGNILLDYLLDSKIIYVEDENLIEQERLKLEKELREKGKEPYYIPPGGSNEIGCLGYIDALEKSLIKKKR